MSFKPIDAKRDEYRKYLEQTGVLELLSKVIIKLFECQNKPDNAIDFIRENMGDAMLEADTITHLKQELEDSRNENAQLKRAMENLKLQLQNNKTATVTAVATEVTAAGAVTEESQGDNAVESDDEQDDDTNGVIVDVPSQTKDCPSGKNAVVDDDEKDIVDEQENKEEITESNKKESSDCVANDQEQQISKETPKTDVESKAE